MITKWAPERIEEVKGVLARHSTVKEAAAELGVTPKALQRAFQDRGAPASRFLRPPDFQQVVPEAHRLRGNSSLLDQNGSVLKRWVKTERDSDNPPAVDVVPAGHLVKKVSTLLDGQGQVRAQWIQAPKAQQALWDDLWKACETHMGAYKGVAERTPAPIANDKNLLTLYPLGDPHIGMYSWARENGQDFDLKIAERDLLSVVDMLVERAPSAKVGVLANVGDFFHAENDRQLTPAGGNKLDCDNRWAKIAEVGFTLMRRMIDLLLRKHKSVIVVNVPGNHDPQMARVLNFWVKAVYEKEPRVSVLDNANPIMYLRHGKTLLGFAHGDGAKPENLPSVMAADRPEDWGETTYRLWVTGHVHHLTRKEYPGCLVESFRTLAPRDAWHHWKGYRAGQSLSCITFDDSWGEITRSTVDLKFARETTRAKAA